MTWTGALDKGDSNSGFIISSHGATLAPGATSVVNVTPKAVGTNPAVLTDTVTITTDIVGDPPAGHFVDLSETPVGDVVVVSSDSFTSQNTFGFGSVPVPSSGTATRTATFTIKNNANFASGLATVTLGLTEANVPQGPVHFSINPPGPLSLAPGAQQTVTVTFTVAANQSEAGDHSGAIAISIGNDKFCTPTNIGTISLNGTATLAQVDIPGVVAFGHVDCGTAGTLKNLAITNPGNQDFTISNIVLSPVVTGQPLYFSFPAADIGTVVASGTTFNLPITPVAIPQTVPAVDNGDPSTANVDRNYSASLLITTNAALDTPHTVAITMGPRGIIVSNDLDPRDKDHDFGSIPFGLTSLFHLKIANSGNAPATVAFTNQTATDVFGLFPNNPATEVNPGGAPDLFDFGFRFTPNAPTQAWTGSGDLVITGPDVGTNLPNGAFCQPLPASWTNASITLHGSSPPGVVFPPLPPVR
jgi:hypothetical protein